MAELRPVGPETAREALIWQALLAMQRHSWEQGVLAQAAAPRRNAELRRAIAHDAVVRQDERGRLGGGADGGLVNCGALVPVVAEAADAEGGDGPFAAALERQRRWLVEGCPRAPDGALLHLEGRAELWVDTVYMVVPALFRLGEAREARLQYELHRRVLRDPVSGLWSHKWDVEHADFARREPWGSGNGWVAAALGELATSASDPETLAWALGELTDLLTAVAQLERHDHRFHDVLTDPDTFTDGTAGLMLATAAFQGSFAAQMAEGGADFDPAWFARATLWADAALERVDEWGLVRDVAGAPHFDRPGTSAEAQAFELQAVWWRWWAESPARAGG